MQQSILKFIALSYRHCSACFGHYCLPTNKPTTAENTSTSTFIRKPEAATAVWWAPDDGHCNARNMLSSVCTTKQYILGLIVASSWVFYLSHLCRFVCFWYDSPQWARASSFTRFPDHTQRRATASRSPLDEWSARLRDLYLTTHNTHNRQTSTLPVGFEPTISAGERPQTYALDRAATGTGSVQVIYHKLMYLFVGYSKTSGHNLFNLCLWRFRLSIGLHFVGHVEFHIKGID